MVRNSSGRPTKFDDEQLDQVIREYPNKHPNEKMTPAKLSRMSGIPEYVFKNRKQGIINVYNENLKACNSYEVESFTSINVYDIFAFHNKNIDDTLNELQYIIDKISQLAYNEQSYYKKLTEMQMHYEDEKNMLEAKLKEKQRIIQELNDKNNSLVYDSMFEDKREEQGIKKDVLSMNEDTINDFEEFFLMVENEKKKDNENGNCNVIPFNF